MIPSNSTEGKPGPDLGKPQFASHEWLEPLVVVGIMVVSLIINRRRGYRILDRERGRASTRPLLDDSPSGSRPESSSDTDRLLPNGTSSERSSPDRSSMRNRSCCGLTTVHTPDNSRFASNVHSRILAKFPFLIEMFYWALNFVTYVATKAIAANALYRGGSVWDLAQDHGLQVLWVEHSSFLSMFFPVHEADFQAWFLDGHTSLITFLNRIYSLVHIPAVVTFLGWYYYAAPSFTHFSAVRRTLTMGNFAAFFVFSLWPCMPPRLLPASYGFHDTVRQDNAESVFVGAAYVNELAAMPSLHFTYAFVTGCTFIYHSCVLPYPFAYNKSTQAKQKRWFVTRALFFFLGIFYPALVLTVIVATANHYYLDACVATVTVTISFCLNKVWYVLLPAEDWFAWLLRVEKPRPTTGDRWCGAIEAARWEAERERSRNGGWKETDEP